MFVDCVVSDIVTAALKVLAPLIEEAVEAGTAPFATDVNSSKSTPEDTVILANLSVCALDIVVVLPANAVVDVVPISKFEVP